MSNLPKRIGVLFEDEKYMVFDKPAGLLVIPTPKNEKNTLVARVNEQYAQDQSWSLHPCHRLDQDTSGAIIFGKGKRAQKDMMHIFEQKKIKKKYIAFVHGRLKRKKGQIKHKTIGFEKKRFQKNAKPQDAVTHYKVLQEKKHFSVIEVEPVTGRTNQIRIHFSQLKHPLVGERKYAFARDYQLKFRRTALHAYSLQWRSLVNQKMVKVTSNLSNDMEVFLARNRN